VKFTVFFSWINCSIPLDLQFEQLQTCNEMLLQENCDAGYHSAFQEWVKLVTVYLEVGKKLAGG